MGDGRTVMPQKYEQEKAGGSALISARKPCEVAQDFAFTARLAKTLLDPGTGLVDPGAAARRRRRRRRLCLPPLAARDAKRHGQPRALSAA